MMKERRRTKEVKGMKGSKGDKEGEDFNGCHVSLRIF